VSVDPSSLIFVVIIGIWAVYLVQHWVRRREQLATSRSLDRFSDAMRVLERRAPIPVALPVSQNRPYVVAPARPLPQQSVPQLPQLPQQTVTSRPEVAMHQAPNTRSERSRTAARPPAAARPSRPAPRRTHRARALIFLTLLVATPAVWAAHVFGTLLLWPTLLVTAAFVVDLLVVRSAVRRSASRRRLAARRTAGASARPAAARRRPAPAGAKTFPVAPSRAVTAAGGSGAAPSMATSALAVEEVRRVHSQEAITEVIMLDGGWEPVAVPPPTYTMKAKAERPSVGSMAPMEADSESAPSREPLVPAVAVDELDLDSVLDRRRAAGE
jgi:hypothetical protein